MQDFVHNMALYCQIVENFSYVEKKTETVSLDRYSTGAVESSSALFFVQNYDFDKFNLKEKNVTFSPIRSRHIIYVIFFLF